MSKFWKARVKYIFWPRGYEVFVVVFHSFSNEVRGANASEAVTSGVLWRKEGWLWRRGSHKFISGDVGSMVTGGGSGRCSWYGRASQWNGKAWRTRKSPGTYSLSCSFSLSLLASNFFDSHTAYTKFNMNRAIGWDPSNAYTEFNLDSKVWWVSLRDLDSIFCT